MVSPKYRSITHLSFAVDSCASGWWYWLLWTYFIRMISRTEKRGLEKVRKNLTEGIIGSVRLISLMNLRMRPIRPIMDTHTHTHACTHAIKHAQPNWSSPLTHYKAVKKGGKRILNENKIFCVEKQRRWRKKLSRLNRLQITNETREKNRK